MAVFDFREQQANSRRWTILLVFLFVLMTAAIGLLAGGVVAFFLTETGRPQGRYSIDLEILAMASGVVMAGVVLTALFKAWSLGGDGAKIAQSLGGEEVLANSSNSYHRRYRNVVEEMSVASGLPMPRVFVINHEQGINAFAAGSSPDRAAIGMTHGALSKLNRDEIAGVVAHEMAHIANSDTRLNVRLMAMVFGLVALSTVGHALLRSTMYAPRRRSKNDGKGALAMVAIAVAFVALGMLGVLGGRILQAAVSRRREYLADATAVQFTRNPQGLAGALSKIARTETGSRMQNEHAEEARHMFFSAATGSFAGLFSTHPPLLERIARLRPGLSAENVETTPISDREAMRDARSEFAGPWGSR